MVHLNSWTVRYSLTNTEKINIENNKTDVKENNNKSNKMNEKLRKYAKSWDKFVYTFCILLCYLNYGTVANLFSPSMVDVKFMYRTTMTKINYGNSLSSVGYITGSLTGFLYKYLNRQLTFIVAIVMLAVFETAQIASAELWQFYGSVFLASLGGGVFDSGNTVWVVEMWGENSGPVFQFSQMMYGLGAIIGPLLVSPYLYGDMSNKTESTDSTLSTNGSTTAALISTTPISLNTTTDTEDINYSVDRRSKLIIPFSIGGALLLTVPTIWLIMFFIKRYKIPENRIQALNEKNETNPGINEKTEQISMELSPRTRKVLIGLVAFSLTAYAGLEMTFFSYASSSYQYLPIHLSASTAAHVMAVMTTTYAIGRGVSAFISSKLKAEVMLTYHMAILFISVTTLYLGQNSETVIYIGNAMLGFGFSAMWPSYFAFAEKYMKLTDKVTSIFSFASSLFTLITTLLLGPIIEKQPEMVLKVEFALWSLTVLLFILIMIILKRAQRYPISYTLRA